MTQNFGDPAWFKAHDERIHARAKPLPGIPHRDQLLLLRSLSEWIHALHVGIIHLVEKREIDRVKVKAWLQLRTECPFSDYLNPDELAKVAGDPRTMSDDQWRQFLDEEGASLNTLYQRVEQQFNNLLTATANPPTDHDTTEHTRPLSPGTKKRSTAKGDARSKIISALAKHHKYDNGSCGNFVPIGVRELERLAVVGKATASDFFSAKFNNGERGGHAKYQIACRERGKLVDSLKLLLGEFPPSILFPNVSDANELEDSGD